MKPNRLTIEKWRLLSPSTAINFFCDSPVLQSQNPNFSSKFRIPNRTKALCSLTVHGLATDSDEHVHQDEEVNNLGVKAALSMLRFYKREISRLLPKSCRYVPTSSEYSMQAYRKYGVVKGSVLTAWRLCRCNPLGGSGYDPPRWFDEKSPPEV